MEQKIIPLEDKSSSAESAVECIFSKLWDSPELSNKINQNT